MLIFGIFSLLTVLSATAAKTHLVPGDNRPELFKATDKHVPTFKVYLPDNELEAFYLNADNGGGGGGGPPGGMPPGGMPPGGMPPGPPPGGMDGEVQRIPPAPNPGTTVEVDNSFKTKNATMTAIIGDKEYKFNKLTFSIGGTSSRSFKKQGYNFKIRGNKDLLGRSQFRLRSDSREPTFLRTKIMCDMQNVLGLTTINANHARLYVNDKFLGFYVMLDAFKLSWAEIEYGDVDSTTLIQCKDLKNDLSVELSLKGCVNENEDFTDISEWEKFLVAINSANSAEEIKDIFDVESFLYYVALEYISASFDHFLLFGHNFYLYRPINQTKWKFLLYDFDGNLGQLEPNHMGLRTDEVDSFEPLVRFSFKDWRLERHLVTILIENDPTAFNKVMNDIVTRAFNPAMLFPRIDELKEFIRPYVEEDKAPMEDGTIPGRVNPDGEYDYNLKEWDEGVEFSFIQAAIRGMHNQPSAYMFGLKRFILERYRYICEEYEITCDPYYLEGGDFTFTEVEFEPRETKTAEPPMETGSAVPPMPTGTDVPPMETTTTEKPTTTAEEPTTTTAEKSTTTTEEPTTATTSVSTETSTIVTDCLAYHLGFPCCSEDNTEVYDTDINGDWGYDFELGSWCGISKNDKTPDEKCWANAHDYPCCAGCTVYSEDELGKWGYEKDEWCGIQSYCN